MNRVGSMFTYFFQPGPVTDFESAKKSDTARFGRFFHFLLDRGVYFPPSQYEAGFVSAAHSEEDIARTGEAISDFFARKCNASRFTLCAGPSPKQRVLVTGAAKRIGRQIAIDLSRSGFDVAIHYGNSEKEAREVSRVCGGAPLFKAELSEVEEIRRMFAEIGKRFGPLDCLVNNAARFTRFDPLEITEADWDFIHGVNLKGTFFCCQEGARMMKQQGSGRIVNISSLGGIRPWADHVHYWRRKPESS